MSGRARRRGRGPRRPAPAPRPVHRAAAVPEQHLPQAAAPARHEARRVELVPRHRRMALTQMPQRQDIVFFGHHVAVAPRTHHLEPRAQLANRRKHGQPRQVGQLGRRHRLPRRPARRPRARHAWQQHLALQLVALRRHARLRRARRLELVRRHQPDALQSVGSAVVFRGRSLEPPRRRRGQQRPRLVRHRVQAARGGHLETLQWMHGQGVVLDEDICAAAAHAPTERALAELQWLRRSRRCRRRRLVRWRRVLWRRRRIERAAERHRGRRCRRRRRPRRWRGGWRWRRVVHRGRQRRGWRCDGWRRRRRRWWCGDWRRRRVVRGRQRRGWRRDGWRRRRCRRRWRGGWRAEPDGAELCAAVCVPQSPPLCLATCTCSMIASIRGNAVGHKASPAQCLESAVFTLLHAFRSALSNFPSLALMAARFRWI